MSMSHSIHSVFSRSPARLEDGVHVWAALASCVNLCAGLHARRRACHDTSCPCEERRPVVPRLVNWPAPRRDRHGWPLWLTDRPELALCRRSDSDELDVSRRSDSDELDVSRRSDSDELDLSRRSSSNQLSDLPGSHPAPAPVIPR